MAYTLPQLPYDHSALAPVIDEQTMTLHHTKHHQTYIDNLNKAVDADQALQGKDLPELLQGASSLPKVVRNNGGGANGALAADVDDGAQGEWNGSNTIWSIARSGSS